MEEGRREEEEKAEEIAAASGGTSSREASEGLARKRTRSTEQEHVKAFRQELAVSFIFVLARLSGAIDSFCFFCRLPEEKSGRLNHPRGQARVPGAAANLGQTIVVVERRGGPGLRGRAVVAPGWWCEKTRSPLRPVFRDHDCLRGTAEW